MSLNCTVAVALGATAADFHNAGAMADGPPITGDAALSSDTAISVAERDGHLVFLTGGLDLAKHLDRVAAALAVPTVAAVFSGVSDTWMWQVERVGETRFWVWSDDEEVVETGRPHAAEQGIAGLDEDTLQELLGRATGVTLDDALLESAFQPVRWPDVRPASTSGVRTLSGRRTAC
jgi:hypothetical protein